MNLREQPHSPRTWGKVCHTPARLALAGSLGAVALAPLTVAGCGSPSSKATRFEPRATFAEFGTNLTTLSLTNKFPAELLEPPTEPYRLGPGDRLEIEILGEGEGPTSTFVVPDGKVYFHLLPGVQVWGLSLEEAKALIEKEAVAYVKSPQAVVTLKVVQSKRVWVLGRVNTPGVYALDAPMTILEAITLYGIVPDRAEELTALARKALKECDLVLITAGSSASVRDMTADVINRIGNPGVLVHGIKTRPGKPTILGVCEGKAVIGLPGNPVSALVNGLLFVVPLLEKLSLQTTHLPQASIRAILNVNLASQAGREDWQPVRLVQNGSKWYAEPVFGKSNLIFTLSSADGLLCIPADATGLSAGEQVDVYPY